MAAARNKFKLFGPRDDEEYKFGSALTLSCHLSPEISAVSMEIRWFKETDCVCLYKNRQVTEGRGYEGRVSLFTQELQRGNVSLQIRDCRESDEGDYLCQVTNGDTTEECTVGVRREKRGHSGRNDRDEVQVEAASGSVTDHLQTEAASESETSREEGRNMISHWAVATALVSSEICSLLLLMTSCFNRCLYIRAAGNSLGAATGVLPSLTEAQRVLGVFVFQSDSKWTEEERLKMEESALLTELSAEAKRYKDKESILLERIAQLMEKDKQIQEKEKLLTINTETLHIKDKMLEEKETLLRETKEKLVQMTKETQIQLKDKDSQLENQIKLLREKETLLEITVKEVESSKKQLETLRKELQDKSSKLQEMMILLEQQKTEVSEKDKQLEEKERLLSERNTQLMERDKQVEEKDRLLEERNKQLQERTDPDSAAPARRRNSKEMNPPSLSGETPESAAQLKRRNSIEELPQTMGGESSSLASPESVPVAELRLVLLGRTGCGKRAAQNTILGREERSQAGASTVRQQSESRQGEVAGRQVTVVDTPDWFCPGLSLEELRQDVGLCVRLSAPGPHAFLLVIPVKQSTGEERGMLEKMEEIFGERCWRNTMILFTVTDEVQEKNIEEFIQSGNQEVQRLVGKCGNRFHCLSIKESGDGSQTSELLEKIEKMVEGNREKFYSSEIYLETQSQIRALETKIMKEREERRVIEEREIKEKLEKQVQKSLRKIEGAVQEHEGEIKQLNNRTTELERRMKEEKDEEKRRELEQELERELKRRTEMEEKVKKLKEKRERERREMEERHRQEMEEIRVTYEGEARMEAERNLMKIILPELQRNILISKSKMQEEFSRQMEEKDRELETLRLRVRELSNTLLEEVHKYTGGAAQEQKEVSRRLSTC
ncbi:trichohyalin-like [Colossoma macropomum]|uniref:trichohyalin-like n=1 Tax=Colossoma macropomum TaxID=42526 RepID=UPI001864324E|nr:trichohyalin-like [Colossoma macropomum]